MPHRNTRIEHCFVSIITSGRADFKYFPQARKHVLYSPQHLRGIHKNSGAGLRKETGAGFFTRRST